MREDDGIATAVVLDNTEAPLFIVADGGLMPVGFGNLDEAVETSLFIERSDGVGDDARASVALGAIDSLILCFFTLFNFGFE